MATLTRMKRFTGCLAFLTLLTGFHGKAADADVKISLDSAYILMGKQTSLHVEMTQPAEKQYFLSVPTDTLSAHVEIAHVSLPDTTRIKGAEGRLLIRQDIILQSFDSGMYAVGPLAAIGTDKDTIHSNPLSLKVLPANVDSLETIHSFAPVVKESSKWWDFIPDFILDHWPICLLVLLVIAAGIVIWLFYSKKVTVPFMPKEKPISPFDQAMLSLDNLKEQHLCEKGLEKEYYTELTNILRVYLERRFGINAMEMTTSQILRHLERDDEIKRHHSLMKRILEIADYVKFAKVRPLPEDNVASWNNAKNFVVDTKPVEPADDAEASPEDADTQSIKDTEQ